MAAFSVLCSEIRNIYSAACVEVILGVNLPGNRLVVHQLKDIRIRYRVFGRRGHAAFESEAIVTVAIEIVATRGQVSVRG